MSKVRVSHLYLFSDGQSLMSGTENFDKRPLAVGRPKST